MKRKALLNRLKHAVLLSDTTPKAIEQAIENHRKQSKVKSLAAIVLVSGKEPDYIILKQVAKTTPMLMYSESAESFEQYFSQQDAVWKAQEKGPKQPSGCKR